MICSICKKSVNEEDIAIIKDRTSTAVNIHGKTYLSTVVKVICKECYSKNRKAKPEKANG